MTDFFDTYLNIPKMTKAKRKYRQQMKRTETLPEDYRFVFKKMQRYMWLFAEGDGMDMLEIQYDLLDLFETGVADGKTVLEVTGSDVAGFCDDLLHNARTYTESRHDRLNREIMEKLGKGKEE